MARIEGCVISCRPADSSRLGTDTLTTTRYPQKMEDHHHKTLTYLPVEIALALQHSPSLIAEAIAAFYEREPANLRVGILSPSAGVDSDKILAR